MTHGAMPRGSRAIPLWSPGLRPGSVLIPGLTDSRRGAPEGLHQLPHQPLQPIPQALELPHAAAGGADERRPRREIGRDEPQRDDRREDGAGQMERTDPDPDDRSHAAPTHAAADAAEDPPDQGREVLLDRDARTARAHRYDDLQLAARRARRRDPGERPAQLAPLTHLLADAPHLVHHS